MTDPTTDALHAERIARLTELANQRWPGQGCRVVLDRYDDSVEVVNDRDVVKLHIQDIRALDALEAALLVLAGESCADDVVRGLAAKLYAERGDTLDRVMQLAREWEERAAGSTAAVAARCGPEVAAAVGPVLEPLVRSMAAELRERAKEQP